MPTLTEARLRACKLWPYGSHAILSLVPVQTPKLATMSVDKHWRLYYDPQAIAEHPVDESAGIILHEVSHLLLKHHHRAQRLVPNDGTQQRWDRWNVATDYAINSMLRQQGISLWDGVLYPEQADLPPNLSGEEYFRLLTANADKQAEDSQDDQGSNDGPTDSVQPGGQDTPNEGQDGQSGDQGKGEDNEPSETAGDGQGAESADSQSGGGTGDCEDECGGAAGTAGSGDQRSTGMERPSSAPGGGDGGSCADGRHRPWELSSPEDSEVPGLKPHEADILVREAAQRILQKACGDGAGGWQQWAKDVISPRVDPRLALLRMVRQAVEVTSGQGDYSYRRPNRRNPRRDMLLPSAVQPIPRITVIVDTSGSMDQRDLGLSLGLIGKVLNGFRIRDGIQVVCGDTQAVVAAKAFDPKSIKLAGGGGTDMGSIIQDVSNTKPRPQLIVVCTDGDTPWCEPVGIPVVACVTQELWAKRVPSWIKTVVLAE